MSLRVARRLERLHIAARVVELLAHGYSGPVERVAGRDSFIPLGDAALTVLLSEDDTEAAAITLARTARG